MAIKYFHVRDMKDGQSFVPVTQRRPTIIYMREFNEKRDVTGMCLTVETSIKLDTGEWFDLWPEQPKYHSMLGSFVVMPVRQFLYQEKRVWKVLDFDNYRKLMDLEDTFI